MKIKHLYIAIMLATIVLTSCTKQEEIFNVTDLCGTFNVIHSKTIMGFPTIALQNHPISNDTIPINDTILIIEKISDTRVKTTGYFKSNANIENNQIYFENVQYYITDTTGNTFKNSIHNIQGVFSDKNTLTFTYLSSWEYNNLFFGSTLVEIIAKKL